MKYDVVVIGGGPAGLSAAVNVRARNKTVLVVTNPVEENPLWKSDLVDNHVGMGGVSGAEMLTEMTNHAKEKGAEFLTGKVLNAAFTGQSYYLSVGTELVEGTAMVLATGVVRQKKFPGEERLLGRGVSYCATCDAFAFRGKSVAVLGYSPTAEHEAGFLKEFGCQVRYFNKPKSCEILGEDRVTGVVCDGEALDVDGVFVLRPAMAPEELLSGLETENGYIQVNRNMETNLVGVFAAGDCTGLPLQVSKAVGEGLIAGQSAAVYLQKISKQ